MLGGYFRNSFYVRGCAAHVNGDNSRGSRSDSLFYGCGVEAERDVYIRENGDRPKIDHGCDH